jgi:hypothetical protein
MGKLTRGEVFMALEESGNRVRMSRGWVSLTSAGGAPLCVAESAVQGLLATVPLLAPLKAAERDALAANLEAVEHAGSESVVVQGEEGDAMYFVEEGKCVAYINRQRVAEYSRGDFFGEIRRGRQSHSAVSFRGLHPKENGARRNDLRPSSHTMRLHLSGPLSESLTGKCQSFSRERSR